MNFKSTLGAISIATALALTGCGSSKDSEISSPVIPEPAGISEAQKKDALNAYANYAITAYTKAMQDAVAMQRAVASFTTSPSIASLDQAKLAWKIARESYGITEILRLSNGPIDAEDGFAASFGAPEGQLNAWPLDENMIDYTSDHAGKKIAGANIINSSGSFTPVGGSAVNVTTINKDTIAALNENGGDANVATGYHAIEFLLWGQDQDYTSPVETPFIADNVTHGPGVAGNRPFTDYTTDANAQRRKDYLNSSSALIIDDLNSMIAAWTTGGYKSALIGEGNNAIAQDVALKQIMGGMGVFLKSELANERMAVAVLAPSEEDEHSCFSDNTHRDIDLNYQGFKNVLNIFAVNLSATQQNTIATQEASIDIKVASINDGVVAGTNFDWQIRPDQPLLRQNIVNAKNEMRTLGDEMIKVALEYGVSLGEGDVTDPEETAI